MTCVAWTLHPQHAFSFYYLTKFTTTFYRCSNFHKQTPSTLPEPRNSMINVPYSWHVNKIFKKFIEPGKIGVHWRHSSMICRNIEKNWGTVKFQTEKSLEMRGSGLISSCPQPVSAGNPPSRHLSQSASCSTDSRRNAQSRPWKAVQNTLGRSETCPKSFSIS